MKPDVFGRHLERVWSLTHGSEQLLSYRETLQILLRRQKARAVWPLASVPWRCCCCATDLHCEYATLLGVTRREIDG